MFKKWAKSGLFLLICVLFAWQIHDKSVCSVIGTQTWGGRMVGADKSTKHCGTPSIAMFPSFAAFRLVKKIEFTHKIFFIGLVAYPL